jgi:hypothetical protein
MRLFVRRFLWSIIFGPFALLWTIWIAIVITAITPFALTVRFIVKGNTNKEYWFRILKDAYMTAFSSWPKETKHE